MTPGDRLADLVEQWRRDVERWRRDQVESAAFRARTGGTA